MGDSSVPCYYIPVLFQIEAALSASRPLPGPTATPLTAAIRLAVSRTARLWP